MGIFDGKVAIITGGGKAKSIGYGIAVAYAKEGANLVLTGRNEQKLLDGSMADMAIATSPNGGGMHIQMENSTLEALGIAGLDVTSKDFSLDSIDKALDMVSERRSSLGASTNALQYTRNLNNSAAINQLSARSRLEDLDFPKAIAKKKQDEVFGQYRIAMLRRQMDEKRKSTMAFF